MDESERKHRSVPDVHLRAQPVVQEGATMKHDLLLGILVGTILGLVFTPTLTPYLPFIVIFSVLVMTKVVKI